MRVALVSVPFGAVERPAIGLTQLKAVCAERFGSSVEVDIHYLNNAFARMLGAKIYGDIASGPYYTSGLGDWLFRGIAFPDEPDNIDSYLRRYFPVARFHRSIREDSASFRTWMQQARDDCSAMLAQEVDRCGLNAYDVVGATTVFSQTAAALALMRMVKQAKPAPTTVLGGANCEGRMGEALARWAPNLDFVFTGSALDSFPRFLSALGVGDSIDEIDGIAVGSGWSDRTPHNGGALAPSARLETSRTGAQLGPSAGTVKLLPGSTTQLRERPITALLPHLDYDSFLDDFDREVRPLGCEPELLFETSRGCWWGEVSQCTFCGLNGLTMKFRELEADQAVQTIRSLFRYEKRCNRLMSVDNIMPRGFTRDVLPRLNTPPSISIFYEVKANLTASDFAALARAGLKQVQPGIESLSNEHLRLMRKGTSSFRNIRLLENGRAAGVTLYWNFLVGFPDESAQPYQLYARELENLFHLPPPSGIYPVRFDRFSPYFDQADAYGLQLRPADFYELTYPLEPEFREDFAYYFSDVAPDAPYRANLATWLRPLGETVTAWQRAWSDGPPPELRYARDIGDGGGVVVDTRRGDVREHRLNRAEVEALRMCRNPRRRDRPPTDGDLSPAEWGRTLDALQERGLIFEDEQRVIGLVFVPSGLGRHQRTGARP